MKKKQLNILLLIVVITIWGFVFRKAFFSLTQQEIPVTKVNSSFNSNENVEYKKDTFALNISNRDPFLNTKKSVFIVKNKISNKKVKNKKSNKPIRKKVSTWPKIKYLGFITKDVKSGKLALLRINNKLQKIREKESKGGIFVKKIYKDSVVAIFNSSTKTIKK